MNSNPYDSPSGTVSPIPFRNRLRMPLVVTAWIMVVASLPIAWLGVELANQEYWQLWQRNTTLAGIESNGTAISITTAFTYLAIIIGTLWLSSTICWLVASAIKRKSDGGN